MGFEGSGGWIRADSLSSRDKKREMCPNIQEVDSLFQQHGTLRCRGTRSIVVDCPSLPTAICISIAEPPAPIKH